MVKISQTESFEAKQGEKMIEINLRFWTNDISPEKGKVLAKHAWSSGTVCIERNKSHGIVPQKPRTFNSLLDINAIIEKVLIDHQIILHRSSKMKKYMKD